MRRAPEIQIPYREIWLSPICQECIQADIGEVLWCQDPAQDDCPICKKKPIRYVLDRRQLPRERAK